MPTVQEVSTRSTGRKTASGYVLVFLSLLTQQISHGFFPFERIPTHFIYNQTG